MAKPLAPIWTLRIIWFALLLGQFAFMGIEVLILKFNTAPVAPLPGQTLTILILVNIIMLLTIVPITFFLRQQMLKRAQSKNSFTALSTGNIIFWAGCEGVTFFALIIVLLHRSFWPTILIAATTMTLQILTFPRNPRFEQS